MTNMKKEATFHGFDPETFLPEAHARRPEPVQKPEREPRVRVAPSLKVQLKNVGFDWKTIYQPFGFQSYQNAHATASGISRGDHSEIGTFETQVFRHPEDEGMPVLSTDQKRHVRAWVKVRRVETKES